MYKNSSHWFHTFFFSTFLDICQVRLDFDTFSITQPSTAGACTTDTVTITTKTGLTKPNIPVLCGTLTGSHSKYISILDCLLLEVLQLIFFSVLWNWNAKSRRFDCFGIYNSHWKQNLENQSVIHWVYQHDEVL